jgi:two-component system, sporulation sensor kinase D
VNLYSTKQRWKLILVFLAIIIASVSIWYAGSIATDLKQHEIQRVNQWGVTIRKKADLVKITNESFSALAKEEKHFVETWVLATLELQKDLEDYSFALNIIQNNKRIPLILTENGNFSSSLNLHTENPDSIARFIEEWEMLNPPIEIKYADNKSQKIYYRNSDNFYHLYYKRDSLIQAFNRDLVENEDLLPVVFIDSATQNIIATNIDTLSIEGREKLLSLMKTTSPIVIILDEGNVGMLHYEESSTLRQLRTYPYIMLSIISLFALVAYFLFSTFRRAEQNQVWVGMAKETAHQLGTPLSSLMAWLELLKEQDVDPMAVTEMKKDLTRLNTVTERFSKIGSETKLTDENIMVTLQNCIQYLEKRVSDKVSFELICTEENLFSPINVPLFEWVIENLSKNAVDAMEGEGTLTYALYCDEQSNFIEITDTGKGIPANKIKTIFEPGYTTKKRGWGLGLSLAKRIVEEHHRGKIAVKSSELNVGTTFLITLKKSSV